MSTSNTSSASPSPTNALVTPASPVPLTTWLRAIRAPSLTATFAPSLATALAGALLGWSIAPLRALSAALGVLIVQIGVNLMNDISDFARGIDAPGNLGGSGVLVDHSLTPERLARAAWLSFGLGALLGLPALLAEPSLLGVVALAALGAWGYSGGPGLKYRALGDLTVLALCGPLLSVGFSLAAFGRADVTIAVLGFAFGLAAVGILHVNNFQDMEVDRASGARTVALALGAQGARVYLATVYLLALSVWPVAALLAGFPLPAALVPLLAAIPITRLVTRLWRASRLPDGLCSPALALVRVDAAKAHLALGALIAAGLAISLAL